MLTFNSMAKIFLEEIALADKKDDKTYIGRCPVCGDSKKDPMNKIKQRKIHFKH
jgi:hypothetical protein